MDRQSVGRIVDGFLFEFSCRALERCEEQESFDFSFEMRLQNDTGKTMEIVSRSLRVLDGGGSEVHQKNAKARQSMQLNHGDALRFEGTCPLSMPIGTVQCELVVKDSDGKTRKVTSPKFQMTNSHFLH